MTYQHPTQIPRSKTLRSLEWTGERIKVNTPKVKGDTYPIAWASDDNMYVGTGDASWAIINGEVYNVNEPIPAELRDEFMHQTTGCVIERFTDGPEKLEVERVNDLWGFYGNGGHGPKPSGMISVDGALYYAVQNLLGWKPPRHGTDSQHGSDATIICSRDFGKTWEPDLNDILWSFYQENYLFEQDMSLRDACWKLPCEQRSHYGDWAPMFPGNLFGGPSFIQFGKDNGDAVDGFVYAISSDHWDNGSEMRLGRVPKDKIMDRTAWEFAIPDGDGVTWTPSLFKSKPVLTIHRHLSLPEMIYLPKRKKYLLFTWGLHTDFQPDDGGELTVLESDTPWGPFNLVYYEWMWYKEEAGCYVPRIPLKWFDQDSLTGYLLFSGHWWKNQVEYYLPQLRPFKIITRE